MYKYTIFFLLLSNTQSKCKILIKKKKKLNKKFYNFHGHEFNKNHDLNHNYVNIQLQKLNVNL